jgi:hypothetical protein
MYNSVLLADSKHGIKEGINYLLTFKNINPKIIAQIESPILAFFIRI